MDITKINSHLSICTWENYDGLIRRYFCRHPKDCCALGCCVSTPFSFYQLWYFWLLLLLIILVCSGGGWWFRWRHGGFSNQNTPTRTHIRARRHRAARTQGHSGVRVYPHPHSYYTGQGATPDDYTLPPGYDKDPPSYNEVIAHLSQFPRADAESGGREDDRSDGLIPSAPDGLIPSAPPVTGAILNCQLSVPPPSYEMVLDLKKREVQLQREINAEEEVENVNSARNKIRNILGRVRPSRTAPESQPPALEAYVPTSFLSSSTTPSGLFTISRESLPSREFYDQASSSSSHSQSSGIGRNAPSPSSHSDYSSSFISSPSSAGRSLVSPPSPPEYFPPSTPRSVQVLTPEPQDPATHREEEPPTLDHAGTSRPCTGRSVLSRPTTSISARTLPPPPQLVRKTSLPGAVLENDEDKGDK